MNKRKKPEGIILDRPLNTIAREAGQAALSGLCAAMAITRDQSGQQLYREDEFRAVAEMAHLIGVRFAMAHATWAAEDDEMRKVLKDYQHQATNEDVAKSLRGITRIGREIK
jgi:hypothetical protein